jgi:hypothetical protein
MQHASHIAEFYRQQKAEYSYSWFVLYDVLSTEA